MSNMTPAEASDIFRREPDEFIPGSVGEVAYRRVGTGPDVLFVHGWPVSGATFRTLLPHLAQHVTCHLIDLPGTGSSRFTADMALTIQTHIESVQRVIDHLGVQDITLVGHDSGGMIARHAVAGDPRLRAMGLINTEPPNPSWRFRSFVAARNLPGFGAGLGWVAGKPRLRRMRMVLGDAFADRSLLDGEFDEFFLQPLSRDPLLRAAAVSLLKSLDMKKHVNALTAVHAKIDVPVQLVWGDKDPFFPVDRARAMLSTFADAELTVLPGVGLFSHEENPQAVADALLPVLTREPAG